MLLLLGALLTWQHKRDRLVSECVNEGGTWDGQEGRCKLLPPIYLERGIHRSGLSGPGREARAGHLRTGRSGKALDR